jgi:hypothetical protein
MPRKSEAKGEFCYLEKEGKVVANHVLPVSSVGILRMRCYGTTLFALSVVKVKVMLPCWHDSE